jgi:hypothetical protein
VTAGLRIGEVKAARSVRRGRTDQPSYQVLFSEIADRFDVIKAGRRQNPKLKFPDWKMQLTEEGRPTGKVAFVEKVEPA